MLSMDPILLQKQVRDNSEELRTYLKDLEDWENDMKRKESSHQEKGANHDNPVIKVKKKKSNEKKQTQKIKGYDYRAWDKFDADAECDKLDKKSESEAEESSDNESDTSEEYQKRLRDEAVYEKERGNQFVKQGKWNEAITCYTQAINCYPKDPIFFANRALCYLKKNDLSSAEADCTSALQFDPNYVKVLQRRAAAKSGLKQYTEAIEDLKRVLKLEPNNSESKKELIKLEKLTEKKSAPKEESVPSSSSSSTSISSVSVNTKKNEEKPKIVEEEIKILWPHRPNSKPLKTIKKLPHQQSKVPLHKIQVEDIDQIRNKSITTEKNKSTEKPIVKTPDKPVEKNDSVEDISINLTPPKSSVQFMTSWRQMKKNNQMKFEYLKKINPSEITNIFREAMESDIFGDIISILTDKFVQNNLDVYLYLKNLSQLKRFSTLTMFMSSVEKTELKKLFDYCIDKKSASEEELSVLRRKYEL